MNRATIKKLGVVLAIIGLLAAVWLLHFDEYLTLSYLKESKAQLASIQLRHPVAVMAVYTATYVGVTALSLPGAAVMTLAGGALFGLITGTVVVSFASTLGATLAFLISRFLLRDWVQERFGQRLVTIHEGIEREGAFYLFTLRLIPVFPFFVINLVMGLTRIPVFTYFWVSQVGMLPATIVYVNAGRELSRIESLSGVLSPRLIFAFVLLGLLPLAAKRLMALYRSRKGGSRPVETRDHSS
jgi:uncharacterized membrane protein YdjX (TVP38/TMEM64 family)